MMGTDLLMALFTGILLAGIAAGYAICVAVEYWKRKRQQRNRRGELLPLRRASGRRG